MRSRLRAFWEGGGGGREVFLMGYPLVLSHASFMLQTFVDRLFLTWYSPEAMAGAVTGLFWTWALLGAFIGTGEYVTTFVAQYVGAGRPERVGPAVWQGLYFAALAGVVTLALGPLVAPAFDLAGHPPELREHEVAYAAALLQGGFAVVAMATLSSFFAGRGRTQVVLAVNVVATLANVLLDWLWIFGKAGFPRAGVVGAAWATVASQALGASLYLALMLREGHRRRYRTASGLRPDLALLGRLVRFGLPAGLQYSLEVAAFAAFLTIVGRLGVVELAATGIAFNLNGLVFMPMLGLGVGVTALVGRHVGAERPDLAERAVRSALLMSFVYMGLCGAFFVLLPGLALAPYAAGSPPGSFAPIAEIATVLLRFVAVYSIFDMLNVICAGGLKGAGDTRYPLAATVVLGGGAMLAPAYLLCVVGGGGVYVAWMAASAYVVLLGLLMMRRFRAGGWRHLRVIERFPERLPDLA